MSDNSEIRYLNPIDIETKQAKYCRFKKSGIKYIDYKDADFLLKLCNEQGKILPRRLTGTSLKYQRKVSQAIKKSASFGLNAICSRYVEIIKGGTSHANYIKSKY